MYVYVIKTLIMSGTTESFVIFSRQMMINVYARKWWLWWSISDQYTSFSVPRYSYMTVYINKNSFSLWLRYKCTNIINNYNNIKINHNYIYLHIIIPSQACLRWSCPGRWDRQRKRSSRTWRDVRPWCHGAMVPWCHGAMVLQWVQVKPRDWKSRVSWCLSKKKTPWLIETPMTNFSTLDDGLTMG